MRIAKNAFNYVRLSFWGYIVPALFFVPIYAWTAEHIFVPNLVREGFAEETVFLIFGKALLQFTVIVTGQYVGRVPMTRRASYEYPDHDFLLDYAGTAILVMGAVHWVNGLRIPGPVDFLYFLDHPLARVLLMTAAALYGAALLAEMVKLTILGIPDLLQKVAKWTSD